MGTDDERRDSMLAGLLSRCIAVDELTYLPFFHSFVNPGLLAAARSGEDFVIGSRMADPEATPAYRYRTNEIGSIILSRMTGLDIEDGQSGYRVLSAALLKKLTLNADGYIIETEMLLKAARHLKRVCHVPVRVIYGSPSHYRPFLDTWVISWGAVYYKVFETD